MACQNMWKKTRKTRGFRNFVVLYTGEVRFNQFSFQYLTFRQTMREGHSRNNACGKCYGGGTLKRRSTSCHSVKQEAQTGWGGCHRKQQGGFLAKARGQQGNCTLRPIFQIPELLRYVSVSLSQVLFR